MDKLFKADKVFKDKIIGFSYLSDRRQVTCNDCGATVAIAHIEKHRKYHEDI